MEPLATIATVLPLAAEDEGGGSFLVSPGLGLMIWTLIFFGATMWLLSKVAFPRIQEALDKRAKLIAESIESVARQPEMKDELQAIRWLGFALTEAVAFYTFIFGLIAFFLS